jgi:Protein of unknown function (DUF3631)
MSDVNVVELPVSPEELQRRLMVEVHRLAGLATVDWTYQLQYRAGYFTEHFGKSPAEMKSLVLACLKDVEKAKAAERRIEQRAEKQKMAVARKQERKQELEQQKIERDAEHKERAFESISKIPGDLRDKQLEKLARRLDQDLDKLREEFAEYMETEGPTVIDVLSRSQIESWQVEAWDNEVDTATLLQELIAKINKHAIVTPHQALAVALWIMLAWVHEVAAYYSPYLVATSAEPYSGKSTLIIDVVGRLTPRPFLGGEPTAATVFRVADTHHPTLLFDDVDTLFQRKPDLASIFKIGYTRGPKIPRTERVMGALAAVWYDPFTPKACTMIGTDMPPALHSRCILIEMKPKLSGEKIEKPRDDDEFKDLCRKLKRWSDDNAAQLKDAPPATDFNNREADNWNLQLAIAQLAGASWRKQALKAAELLTRTMRKPSWRQLLLAEFQIAFKKSRNKDITSQEFFTRITTDPLSIWHDYNHGNGTITQRQVAHLLRGLKIYPVLVGRARVSGWRAKDFQDAFARYLPPGDPLIVSGREVRL